ncbi:MAG: AraC family transcriptional regulator [Henriciella sp.]
MTSLVLKAPLSRDKRRPNIQLPRISILWLLLTISLTAFIAEFAIGSRSTTLSYLLQTMSCVSCGLSWLFTRELFAHRAKSETWPYVVVSVLFLATVTLIVTRTMGLERDGVLGVISEATVLISSTVLVLPFLEALNGFGRMSDAEKRFRSYFVAGYGLILGTATVLAIPSFAEIEHTGQVVCCLLAMAMSFCALRYRQSTIARKQSQSASDQDIIRLASDLTGLLDQERVYLDPDIKVGDLARRLRQPDYKVTRCITQHLGFQNFNQMINDYRIEEAKRLLSDPRFDELSILAVAMESGFGSVGPFNRAFKQRTQQTPLAFRRGR